MDDKENNDIEHDNTKKKNCEIEIKPGRRTKKSTFCKYDIDKCLP